MEIGIGVTIKAAEEKYTIDLKIPTEIKKETPFCFTVSQPLADNENNKIVDNDILHVSFSDKDHVYVQVKPSEKLLEQAMISEYVENLQAVIEEGKYDKSKKKFIESVDSNSNLLDKNEIASITKNEE